MLMTLNFVCSWCKTLKTDSYREICTCFTLVKPFFQMHTMINLSMFATASHEQVIISSGFTYQYKKKYAQKTLNEKVYYQL